MKKQLLISLIIGLLFVFAFGKVNPVQQYYPEKIEVTVANPAAIDRADEVVALCMEELSKLSKDFNPCNFIVQVDGKEVPSQACDIDNDGEMDQIVFNADFGPEQTRAVTLRYAKDGKKKSLYKKRTQAEISHKYGGYFEKQEDQHVYEDGTFKNVDYLKVPSEHTDHSFYIRYEGPGWESDKVGYRMYLDWRNGFDIYGKKTTDMVLQEVGQDGFESYHEMSDWGMDILKVGNSLGSGSFGMWVDGAAQRVSEVDQRICEIPVNGALKSQVTTHYKGWQVDNDKFDVVSNLSILAGDRKTKHCIKIDGDPSNLCTGLVKHENTDILESDGEGWNYCAIYGKQSLNEDNLGMAIFYDKEALKEVTEDENSHVIVLNPEDGKVTYYLTAAWELEPNGIQNQAAFEKYLTREVKKLNNPLDIEY